MKKNKSEVVLLIIAIAFVIAGMLFYGISRTLTTTLDIPFEEIGTVNYKVYLNDNTYYNKDYLDEGMQYISSIIDYIDLDFKYDGDYKNVSSYDIVESIKADVKITDFDDLDKIIYAKSEILKEDKIKREDLSLTNNIKIDYKKYNNLVNDIKSKYAISAKAVLKVTYQVYFEAEDKVKDTKILTIDIPLSEQMINIQKGNNIDNYGTYKGQTTTSVINGLMAVLMVLMFIGALTTFASFIMKVRERIDKESKYDRFIAKVLREYDSYITEALEESNLVYKDIIKVNSFKELLDVRNNIDKAIVYTKVDENTSKFQIIDEEVYEYVVTREEMDI